MNCFNCPRKYECFTESGIAKLSPNDPDEDCGALFRSFEESRAFIHRIGEALCTIPQKHRDDILTYLTASYGTDIYAVLSELYPQ